MTTTFSFEYLQDQDRSRRWDLVDQARQAYLDNIGTRHALQGDNLRWVKADMGIDSYRRWNLILDGVRIGWVGKHDSPHGAQGWHSTLDSAYGPEHVTTYYDDHPTRIDAALTLLNMYAKTGG